MGRRPAEVAYSICQTAEAKHGESQRRPDLRLAIAEPFHRGDQTDHRDCGGDKAGEIEGAPFRFANIRDNAQRKDDGCEAQRDIDKEDPVPAGVAGDKAAQRRADNGGHQRRPGEGSDGFDQQVFRRGSQYRQATDRDHQRASDPLQDTHGDKSMHLGGEAAEDRGKGKDRQGEGKNSAGAEAIGDPTAGRDQYREGDQIGADADIQLDRGDAKIFRHIGQRGGDHRPVEKLHKKSTGHQQRRR